MKTWRHSLPAGAIGLTLLFFGGWAWMIHKAADDALKAWDLDGLW